MRLKIMCLRMAELSCAVFIACMVSCGSARKAETAQKTEEKKDEKLPIAREETKEAVALVSEGCAKPPSEEIESFYKDNAGSLPVPMDFDAEPGEICGNGKTYYCTSLPTEKPVPLEWKAPPRPGTDPSYQGLPFDAPFKESPHAMPSSKAVFARHPILDLGDATFVNEVLKAMGKVDKGSDPSY